MRCGSHQPRQESDEGAGVRHVDDVFWLAQSLPALPWMTRSSLLPLHVHAQRLDGAQGGQGVAGAQEARDP